MDQQLPHFWTYSQTLDWMKRSSVDSQVTYREKITKMIRMKESGETTVEIRMEIVYLTLHTGGYWSTIENQKIFLNKFAQKRCLDPLNPNSWYYVTVRDITNVKVLFLQHNLCLCGLCLYISASLLLFLSC